MISKSNRGYTLIELMTVMVIITVLAAIAVPHYFKVKENVRKSLAKNDASLVRIKVLEYFEIHSTYPDEAELLNVNIRMSEDNVWFDYFRDTSLTKMFSFSVSNTHHNGKYIVYRDDTGEYIDDNW